MPDQKKFDEWMNPPSLPTPSKKGTDMSQAHDAAISAGAVIGLGTMVLLIIGGGLYGCPRYNVWSAEMAGKAELAQADQNRQIQIAQSKAKAEAAQFEADAEITRAQGVAKANKIVGDSLAGPSGEAYLRYLWVNKLSDDKEKTVVYVPTESAMPNFLEAGRVGAKQP
jgi:hypothetical protein